MRTNQRGFTLIEVLVASVVLAIFMIGMLNLLDTSTRVAQIESSLADTQENVRFAAYHIMRTARMMGGAAMPFAGSTVGGGGDNWVSGQMISNATGTIAIPGYGNVTVLPGSDVLTLRGFFEIKPFFTNPLTVLGVGGSATIDEYNVSDQLINDVDGFTLAALEGRGIVFMGEGHYCVGELDSGAAFSGTGFDRKLVLKHIAGDTLWPDLNTDSAYPPTAFAVYQIGILESYTYFVSPDNVLRRVRVSGDNPQAEPVAINIGGLQLALGVDSNDDGTIQTGEWKDDPSVVGDVVNHDVLGMRIAVLGRTEFGVPGWTEPDETFEVEDGASSNMKLDAKWRRVEVYVNLRNYKF